MASCTAAGDDESDSSKQKSNGVLRRGNPNVDRSSLTALCEQELEAFGKLRVQGMLFRYTLLKAEVFGGRYARLRWLQQGVLPGWRGEMPNHRECG